MLQMQSTVRADGFLDLAIVEVPQPNPEPHQVLIRVQAAPINPSDLGAMFGGAERGSAQALQDAVGARVKIPPAAVAAMSARVGRPVPCGNEGAGVVVAAGESAAAQALLGKTVATWRGAMYAQFKLADAQQCLPLPADVLPAQGASCFVNPLTVLGMVETMRQEGHAALAHTAAASNLGQMLQRVCTAEGIALVNVVRRAEHEKLLQDLGARQVVDSSADSFEADLADAFAATGATIAFDATGGGALAGQLLAGMETALARSAGAAAATRYGTATHKQVYIYGGLQAGPTVLNRAFGMAWGVGGWLLPMFLERIGNEAASRLRARVAAEITTTFASSYAKTVSLAEAVAPEAIARYGKQATGEKYLIDPSLDR